MTKEELYTPRYKVISDYPGSIYKVGDTKNSHLSLFGEEYVKCEEWYHNVMWKWSSVNVDGEVYHSKDATPVSEADYLSSLT